MKLLIQTVKKNPSNVEEIVIEDVDRFAFNETEYIIYYNNGEEERVPIRSNDGIDNGDWIYVSINVIRKFMTVDMTK